MIFETEMKEMRKLKKQFIRELKTMIESEVIKEKQRRQQEEKLERYKQKMLVYEQEKKHL